MRRREVDIEGTEKKNLEILRRNERRRTTNLAQIFDVKKRRIWQGVVIVCISRKHSRREFAGSDFPFLLFMLPEDFLLSSAFR